MFLLSLFVFSALSGFAAQTERLDGLLDALLQNSITQAAMKSNEKHSAVVELENYNDATAALLHNAKIPGNFVR